MTLGYFIFILIGKQPKRSYNTALEKKMEMRGKETRTFIAYT